MKRFFQCLITTIGITLMTKVAAEPMKVKVISRGDSNAEYCMGLIELGLQKAGVEYRLDVYAGELTRTRLKAAMEDGNVDVIWTATSEEMEAEVIPIRIPVYKGLMGHRVLLVHRDNQRLFSEVNSFNDLMGFKLGQGRGWPDTTIMKHNGLTVVEATKYSGLFHMTDGKRFDAFPRGIHEPWSEMEARKNLALAVDAHVMLVYKMPFYLFVNPQKAGLAKDLERGLMAAIEDGSFDQYFYQNETVQMVLKKVNLSGFKVFELENPDLPRLTPVDDAKLWVDLQAMSKVAS